MKKNSLISYAKKNVGLYIFCFTMLIAQIILRVVAPTLLSKIIDEVIGKGNVGIFPLLLIEMVTVYLTIGLFAYLQEYTSDIISKKTGCEIRKNLFSSITKEDGSFFNERTPADLMSRSTSDTDSVGFIFGFCGIFVIEIVAIIVSQFFALFRVSKKCSIVAIVCLPIIGFLAFKSEIKGDKISDAISDKRAELNDAASQAIMGIRTVKSFNKEKKEEERFASHARSFRNLNKKIDRLWIDWCTPEATIATMMVPLTLLIGGFEVIGGRMSLGELTMAIQYTSELSWPMMEIGWLFVDIAAARAGWRKIKAIMERKPEIADGDKALKKKDGVMRFENVGLSSNGRTLLENISFTIEKGKTVAIMGASGSGKSLLTSLAVRFLDPTEGRITIDGIDIRDIPVREARDFSSIVTQDVFLFSDTVKNNIALGRRRVSDSEEVIRACVEAEADDFIKKLENGYETVIGERGVGLSGGQKQRLSIARAFMRKNDLLILDDATSALDMETEKEIENTIKKEGKRSILITAHRISAVCNADEIIILDKGRIKERGTHSELLKKKGLYWETYISQYPEEENRE